jgi:hypothetical protein
MQTTTPSDDEWVEQTRRELAGRGIVTRMVPPPKKSTRWCCEVFRHAQVYCVEIGETPREALTKAVATVTAAQLDGLKFRP